MVFAVTKNWMNDTGRVYEAQAVKRYINGYLVEINGYTFQIMNEDIQIIEISDAENNLPIKI